MPSCITIRRQDSQITWEVLSKTLVTTVITPTLKGRWPMPAPLLASSFPGLARVTQEGALVKAFQCSAPAPAPGVLPEQGGAPE